MAFGNSLYKALKSSNVWRPLLFPSFSGIASFNSRASSRGPKGQRDYTITHSDFVEWDISSPSSYKLFRWEPPHPYKLKTDRVYVNSPHPYKPCCWKPRPYKPCCCVYDKMEIDKPCCCVYDKMESRFR